MSTPVIAIGSNADVYQAKSVMQQNKINRLVVLSDKNLSGLLTYRNILDYYGKARQRGSTKLENSISPTNMKVADIAETNVHTIDYKKGIDDALRNLVENRISSLVVTRAGKPVGVLSIRDILEAITKETDPNKNNIILSGLDQYTAEYGEEIMGELNKLDDKINRFHKVRADMIALHVKRLRQRNYEMKIRVWLERRGAVSAYSRGFSVDSTLKDLLGKVYNTIKSKKDIIYTERKGGERPYEESWNR